MNIYTVIMEFRGGTYISQVRAENTPQAVEIWAKELNTDTVQYLGDKNKNQLINDLPVVIETELSEIDTVKNVWLILYQFTTGIAYVHFIKTADN